MDIQHKHSDYQFYSELWARMEIGLKGETAVKAASTLFLPKTQGMIKNDLQGTQYTAYKDRARFLDITSQALSAIVGLLFEKKPTYNEGIPFAIGGQNDGDFSVDVVRSVVTKGRYIAVVDVHGTDVLVSGYAPECMINWEVNDKGVLSLAVFEEISYDEDDEKVTQYREYKLVDGKTEITVYDESSTPIQPTIVIDRDQLDIITFGSIDLKPSCDKLPLLPILECAVSAYQLSADYKHALYMSAQPTPWVTGIDEGQWTKMLEQGIGSSSLWWLGDEGQTGFLETNGQSIAALKTAIDDELKHAESHAVKLSQQTGGVESAESISLRSASQQASIHSIVRSVEEGMNILARIIAERSIGVKFEEFALSANLNPTSITSRILLALNTGVSQMNVPQSVLFNALRQMRLTEKTDEELLDEMKASGQLGIEI